METNSFEISDIDIESVMSLYVLIRIKLMSRFWERVLHSQFFTLLRIEKHLSAVEIVTGMVKYILLLQSTFLKQMGTLQIVSQESCKNLFFPILYLRL